MPSKLRRLVKYTLTNSFMSVSELLSLKSLAEAKRAAYTE